MVDSNAPLPWIGVYAAIASLACVVALMADICHSIRHRKLWFPCRYTSLNAASLTVLAVAVKLSMDLTTPMTGIYDQLAKGSSTGFLCASMTHFMPSLGSMKDRDVLLNLIALGILQVTLSVNVIIQVFTQVITKEFKLLQLVNVFMIVYTFIILCSCALTTFTSKRYLECKYNKVQKRIASEESHVDNLMDFDTLKSNVKRYWVMAETGNPQFVMARSEATGVLFMICISSFLPAGLRFANPNQPEHASDYKWSVFCVYFTQYVGMALCTIMSFGRVLVALLHTIRNKRKCTVYGISFEIKNYSIKRLIEWKKRPPPSQFRGHKLRKIIYETRNLLLNIFIGSQIVIVIGNKLLLPISMCGLLYILIEGPISQTISLTIIPLTILLFLCISGTRIIRCLMILKRKLLREPNESEDMLNHEQDLGNFVLLLKTERVHAGYLKLINTSINSSIMEGAKNQPKNLIELIDQNYNNFQGVLEFESDQVSPMLMNNQPPNCWSLTIATLTSIMMALPNIQHERRNRGQKSVVEGFKYVRLVDKTLDGHKRLVISRIAADSVWIVLEFKHKWLDVDLMKLSLVSKSSKETLERFAYKSEEILKAFMSKINGDAIEIHPINLPESVILANSMYKITNTLLLLAPADERSQTARTDSQLFDKLFAIIADILAACLSNLPHVILKKCSDCAIEEREESARDATLLLGETQGLMKALQKREIPNISRDQLVYIDEWRAFLKRTNNEIPVSTSSPQQNVNAASSSEVHLDVQELHSNATAEALKTHEDYAESRANREAEEFIEAKELA